MDNLLKRFSRGALQQEEDESTESFGTSPVTGPYHVRKFTILGFPHSSYKGWSRVYFRTGLMKKGNVTSQRLHDMISKTRTV